jgi:alpha-D-xyloside xylohydrolase
MELRIYPGADGHFELYDDEGDGYGYQKGKYATIDLHWNDSKHELTVGKRQGVFPGMPQKIAFTLVCGAGERAEKPSRLVYSGASKTISLPTCR